MILILNIYGFVGLVPLFSGESTIFEYRKGRGHIDMLIHSPGDNDSKYIWGRASNFNRSSVNRGYTDRQRQMDTQTNR